MVDNSIIFRSPAIRLLDFSFIKAFLQMLSKEESSARLGSLSFQIFKTLK